MAYYKAKLKSIGDRASPCFKSFLIGNLSEEYIAAQIQQTAVLQR